MRHLLVLLAVLAVLPCVAQVPSSTPIPGDVNRDGVVDHDDLLILQQNWQLGEKSTLPPPDAGDRSGAALELWLGHVNNSTDPRWVQLTVSCWAERPILSATLTTPLDEIVDLAGSDHLSEYEVWDYRGDVESHDPDVLQNPSLRFPNGTYTLTVAYSEEVNEMSMVLTGGFPETPEILSPSDGSQGNHLCPAISWISSEAHAFDLTLRRYSVGEIVYSDWIPGTDFWCEVPAGILARDTEYEVMVGAINAAEGTYVPVSDELWRVQATKSRKQTTTFTTWDVNRCVDTIVIDLPGLEPRAKPLEMIAIQPGAFMMGSPPRERNRDSNEGLQHPVTISQAFYMGKYEVTQAQWQAVMGTNPSHHRGNANHPVEQVSWDDCQAFVQKMNLLGVGEFRLPTESEWEYVCRAGTTERFSYGDALECSDTTGYCESMDRYMWWGGNNTPYGTKDVGLKLPNPWGLYDLHGNVYEWCEDWYGVYSDDPVTDPQGPSEGTHRVGRGGSWSLGALYCRSAARNYYVQTASYYFNGLRLVRSYP